MTRTATSTPTGIETAYHTEVIRCVKSETTTAATVTELLVNKNRPSWSMPARARYNYVCLLVDQGRWQAAIEELAQLVGDPDVAAAAKKDPSLKDLPIKCPEQWRRLFPSNDLADTAVIGPFWAGKLHECDIDSVRVFLNRTSTRDGLVATATCLDAPVAAIERWRNIGQLVNLQDLSPAEANLLVDAGIQDATTLSKADADALVALLGASNRSQKRLDAPPSVEAVKRWIKLAKELVPTPPKQETSSTD